MSTPASASLRDRLLEAARQLANEDEPLTVESVARAASVSRAHAYRTLGSIQGLLDELVMERLAEHAERSLALVDEQRDTASKIEALCVYTVTALPRDPVLSRALWQDGDDRSRTLHQLARDFVHPLLSAGQQSGQIRDDVDTDQVADWLVDCFVGSTVHRPLDVDGARRLFRTFFAPALQPRSRRSTASSVSRVEDQLRRSIADLERLRATL